MKEKINFFCWVCFQCAENDRDGSIANSNIVGIEEGRRSRWLVILDCVVFLWSVLELLSWMISTPFDQNAKLMFQQLVLSQGWSFCFYISNVSFYVCTLLDVFFSL